MIRRSSLPRLVRTSALAWVAALLLNGCAAVPPGPGGPQAVATVTAADGDAYIKRASGAETRATVGDPLYSGDGFRTDAGTMQISTPSGGRIDVFPNTDPVIQAALCFGVSFFHKGKLHIIGHGMCVNGTYQASDVGYEALAPDVMRVSVFEGEVRLLAPPFRAIRTGQRGDVQNGQLVNVTTFTPAEFGRLFPPVGPSELPPGRLQRIMRPPPPPPEEQPGPGTR